MHRTGRVKTYSCFCILPDIAKILRIRWNVQCTNYVQKLHLRFWQGTNYASDFVTV